MAFDNKKAIWLTAGVLSGLGTMFCIREFRKFIKEKSTRKPLSMMEDSIRLEDLEVLVRSANYSLRKSAEQVVLDRAMKDENIYFIVKTCYSKNELQILKSVVALSVLVKNSERVDRDRLIERGVLESLSHALVNSVMIEFKELANMGGYDFRLQRCVSESLFHLIYDDDSAKIRLVEANSFIVGALIKLMAETRNKEVMRWSVFIIHQLSACDSLRPLIIDNGVVSTVSEMLVRNQGDFVLMRTCLHTMLMFVNNNTEEEVVHLKEMAKYDVFRPAVVSLRADDSDLVYWAAGLLHQFAIQDLHKAEICAIPNIIKALQNVLCSSEAILQRLILRVLSFLCVGNQPFRTKVLACSSLLARLPVCLASGDNDIVHWAVVLLHDLILSEGSHTANRAAAMRVLSAANDVIKSLVSLVSRTENILIRLVAELLGLFCTMENLQKKVLEDGCLKAILTYAVSSDSELQLWASALLLNVAMMSDEIKGEIIRLGGLKPLMELAIGDSDHPRCAIHAAKTLVMLGFLDTKIPVNIKSSGYKTGDQASICINGKEYSLNKPGINIVVMDLLTFQVTERASFDTGHDKEASEQLIECIDMIPVGSLVFMAVKGEANYFLSDKAKMCLKDVGLEECDFKTGELWSLCGYKNRDKGTAVAFLQGYDVAQLDTSLNLGCYTNEQVQGYILLPLIELLMSTPATLAISKVSELELLTVLARHDNHKEVMVNSDGFMDYIVELINNMSHKTADQLRANPLVIAHCIGAMKILTAISIAKESHEGFTQHNVVDTILALLSLINGIQLDGLKERMLLSGAGQLQIDGVHDWQSDHGFSITHTFASPCENVSTIAEEVKLTASGLRSPLPDHTQDSSTPLSTVQLKSSLTKKSSVKPRQPESVSGEAVVHDDLDEAFSNLTGLSMVTLYNCIDLISSSEESREHFLKAGAMQIVWCRLLTANASTLQQIALPTEMLLNTCCCMSMLEKYYSDILVELDEHSKTPALVISADRLEVANPNWTFESVRATLCVGRGLSAGPPYPAGWYYEVTLKSSGILQIGWQTEDCRYGPERGAGVGDDKNSCAFDGARCKIWNGPLGEQINNDYGKEWSSGDVLSCLFSWNGEVSYWLNGVDMGVAFRGLNTGVNWYPAASVAMDQTCSFNFGDKPFRYNMPEGYVAVSHIVSNLVKKNPLRLSSCWTPVSGSFESIVEEDEELNDDKDLETTNTEPGNRDASSSSKKVDILVMNEKPTQLTLEHGSSASEMFSDPRETSELCGSSLTQSFEPASHSLTFGTPSCSILTETPRASPIKPQPSTLTYTPGSIEQTPLSAEGTGERIAPEEKPPCEEKHVTKRVIPCLYFEAELKQAPCRVKQMGFINKETKEKIYCDIHDGHLQLPKTSSPSSCEQERVPDIVGCAVVLSTGQVMFTLDGVPTGQFYDFPTPIDRLSPYISCTRIRCNYGQRSFLFEDANTKESFSCSGSLLYNCLRSVNTVKKH
ncbi:uncharacterized protein [Acropora muricata]|uniref:uncharacterized protein isoform X2 n=1 Tax=Acropora muricata TaxID=159855 RepID=UPI0034E46B0C